MSESFFIYPDEVDRFAFDWGHLTVTCGPSVNGAGKFSAGVVHVPPGQGHSRHNHPGSEEIIYVLEGAGEQMVEDTEGNPVTEQVRAGCTIFVPESRFHSTLNTGDAPMKLFVVYSPAGPEELLRQLPDFRLVHPPHA
ncbi:MAG: cupin domain-containing protein [Hoeflea sp.]|uniref:cupin domain-containing protein n=1 Tax=Hoeflea sp. TaxID=1940281 RepID=UPI002730FF37|nr:cupin domain-containing protein [Hoeflea sp.]MDP2121901.1 cupin domain-containing protein [Hoeflea sp.]MDP3523399.1 cupin domain-containing protein [Hoeflea sp.]